MVINIRRSRPDEGDKLTAIWCRSVDATHDFLTKRIERSWRRWYAHFTGGSAVVAVNTEDQPIAFMLLTGEHMDALFVDPDVRGCGVGKLLIEHALSLTPKLTTNVNEQNEQAVGFYQKMGFRVTGRSETDDLGQPYPLLNLMYEQQAEADYD
ncbi:acetyltransferase [Klebsiella pneumoniae]